jgi:hypothetical protein
MKVLFAAALMGTAVFALVGELVWAGLGAGPALQSVALPVLAASAAGALLWSSTEQRRGR